jgi:hypothetical protein
VLHVFRFDRTAVDVPAEGQRLGDKYRLGAWCCVECKALMSFCIRFDADHGDDCPGLIEAASGYLE